MFEVVAEIIREVFSLLNSLLEPELKTWLIVLIAIGFCVKYWVKVPSKLIPLVEGLAGLVIAYFNCIGKGMGAIGILRFVVGQGLLMAAFSTFIYSVGKALIEIVILLRAKALQPINKEETN